MATVQCRGRDEVIFGTGTREKRKDPLPTPELQRAIEGLTSTSTVDDYKAVGNECVKQKIFTGALKYYSAALEHDPSNEILLSNRSAAYLQSTLLSGPSLALKDAERCIQAKPTWFKGYLRKGDALFAMKKLERAAEAYGECLKRGDCATAAESKANCLLLLRQQTAATADAETSPERGTAFHRYDEQPPTERQKKPEQLPDPMDADAMIKHWSQDTGLSSGTARKHFGAKVEDADRESGKTYKDGLMTSFRKKLDSDKELKKKVDADLERDRVMTKGYDYRTGKTLDESQYDHSTDAVGRAISADSYNTMTGKQRMW